VVHGVQLLRPALLAKNPGEHVAQLVEFKLTETVPLGQASHDVVPALAWKKPGWQGLHVGD
jgi:hypothetical protein